MSGRHENATVSSLPRRTQDVFGREWHARILVARLDVDRSLCLNACLIAYYVNARSPTNACMSFDDQPCCRNKPHAESTEKNPGDPTPPELMFLIELTRATGFSVNTSTRSKEIVLVRSNSWDRVAIGTRRYGLTVDELMLYLVLKPMQAHSSVRRSFAVLECMPRITRKLVHQRMQTCRPTTNHILELKHERSVIKRSSETQFSKLLSCAAIHAELVGTRWKTNNPFWSSHSEPPKEPPLIRQPTKEPASTTPAGVARRSNS